MRPGPPHRAVGVPQPQPALFCAEIIGADLRQPVDEANFAVISDVLHDNAVLVIPGRA